MSIKKYGVIICSECKRTWDINLSQKTTKCPQCGKLYNVFQRKIFYNTSNLRELQMVIAKIREKLLK